MNREKPKNIESIGRLRNLAVTLILLAVPAHAQATAQEEGQEIALLKQRVEALETALDSLRSEYGARLDALEQKLATPDAAAEEPPSLSDEERASLEEELAGILGESEVRQASQEQAAGPEEVVTTPERTFTGRTRNLNKLNPEISVTGDTFLELSDDSGNPESNRFRIAEFELAFQAPLDPFSLAKAFVVQEDGEFELEEAYIDWTSFRCLPQRLRQAESLAPARSPSGGPTVSAPGVLWRGRPAGHRGLALLATASVSRRLQ
jgi:hypothetical protein